MNPTLSQASVLYFRLRSLSIVLEHEWRTRPRFVLACSNYADEHWQIFHPHCTFPTFTLALDGTIERHPDGFDSAVDLDRLFE